MKEFFPTESLEPARRPPTVHAMPKALQSVISTGHTPREKFGSLLASCGGYLFGSDGRMYLASHTENVLAIRKAAPFQIARLPPGVPSRQMRTGECVEAQKP